MRRRAARALSPLAILLLLSASPGCGRRPPPAIGDGWAREPLRFARYFQLWERGAERMLLTFGPGGTADTTGIFVIGGNGPAAVLPRRAVRLAHPLGRVALMSTTHASFIAALGRAGAVAGCAHADRLRDPLVAALAQAGKLEELATADGLDRERVLMLGPDALFTYPYGNEGNLKALGNLPVVPISEYLEKHPLGRAEWVRAFGVLLGRERAADSLFRGIAERYQTALDAVAGEKARPSVFFGSAWKGTWSVPAGNSYMAQLIGDAGGRYLFADRQAVGNIDLDIETALTVGAGARFWGRILDQAPPVTASDVAGDDARILGLPAFQGHGAFCANSSESDVFGQAGLEPDVVLLDLVGIFHPGLAQGRKPVYFRPVQ